VSLLNFLNHYILIQSNQFSLANPICTPYLRQLLFSILTLDRERRLTRHGGSILFQNLVSYPLEFSTKLATMALMDSDLSQRNFSMLSTEPKYKATPLSSSKEC